MSPDEQLELLRRFAPTLHFDALERWRPDRVEDYLLHSAVLDGKERAQPGTPPAEPAMHEHGDDYKAQLNPLRSKLNLNTQLRSAEMLSAYGREQNLACAGVAYGRVVPTAGEGFFLQYWLFYPDNPCVLPPGRHDGDWELVQVKVESRGNALAATQVTLAEHGKPVSHGVDPGKSSQGPDVFVAVDSHACYFDSGAHPALLSDICDPADAPGVKPKVTLLPIASDKRDWAHWPGRWGLDRGGGTRLALGLHLKRAIWPLTLLNKAGDSPRSPGHQGTSWRFPKTFAVNGTGRKWTAVAARRFVHFLGYLTWPKKPPFVSVTEVTPGSFVIETRAAGHFARRVSFVSVSFEEEGPDGRRRGLAMYSVSTSGTPESFDIPHKGPVRWSAAGYNRLRQRGEPIRSPAQ